MSLPNHIPFAKRQEVSARWHAAKEALRMARPINAETLRWRALHDARGTLLRRGCTYTDTDETHWSIVRSIRGRTDQRDVLVDGQLFRTCGPRRLPAWLR